MTVHKTGYIRLFTHVESFLEQLDKAKLDKDVGVGSLLNDDGSDACCQTLLGEDTYSKSLRHVAVDSDFQVLARLWRVRAERDGAHLDNIFG